jgi:hypothetical protein
MWILIGIGALVVLIGLVAVLSPGSPGREMRNKRDGESAGWRSGGNVSWFHDTDRRD